MIQYQSSSFLEQCRLILAIELEVIRKAALMVGGEIALPTANSELYVTVSRYTAPQSMVI